MQMFVQILFFLTMSVVALIGPFVAFALCFLGRRGIIFAGTNKHRIKDRPSFTAELAMACRAMGTKLRLCNDPVAYEMCEWDTRIIVQAFVFLRSIFGKRIPLGMTGMIVVRTVELDAFIQQAGAAQVVLLGAGMDARAYRLSTGTARYFEVDVPSTQTLKKETILQLFKANPKVFPNRNYEEGRVTFVACDFSANESFMSKLLAQGFDNHAKSIVVLEGVVSYLTWEEIQDTLRKVTDMGPGTLVAMNAVQGEEVLKTKQAGVMKKYIREQPKFVMKSTDTAVSLFEPLGFTVLRDISFIDAAIQYEGLLGEKLRKFYGRLIFMEVK